ncbi:MAG: NTP transferase domain-containing protein [Vicinamibacteraceae bacterium]
MIRPSSAARPSAVARHDALVILQARMGSSRLPGKVLARLGHRSVLAQCIERLLAARVGEVVVATTTRPEDEAIVAEANAAGVAVTRGPVDDVLGRFVGALDGWTGPYVIRATADNPFVDVDGPARLLRLLDAGADYAVEEGLPLGAAVEAMRVEVLREAGALASTAYEREHVTPFIRQSVDRFAVCIAPAPFELRRPSLRLTVDTRDDLHFVRSLVDQTEDASLLSLGQVIALADRSARWAGVA